MSSTYPPCFYSKSYSSVAIICERDFFATISIKSVESGIVLVRPSTTSDVQYAQWLSAQISLCKKKKKQMQPSH